MKKKVCHVVKFVFILLIAILFLLPEVLTITNSLMSTQEIKANYGSLFNDSDDLTQQESYISSIVNLKFIPDKISIQQYITVLFKSPDYLYKFWNSVIYTVPIVIVQLAVSMGAAYSFTRNRGKITECIFFVYIVFMLMPNQVTLVPNFIVNKWMGTLNTRWAIWLSGFFTPFSVFILTKFLRRVPDSIIESAEIDGANEWQIFTKICVPISKSALFSVALLGFIDYWNMIEQPLILLDKEELFPLSIYLSSINTGEIGIAFAVATIYMIPSILLYLYGEDYLINGLASAYTIKG